MFSRRRENKNILSTAPSDIALVLSSRWSIGVSLRALKSLRRSANQEQRNHLFIESRPP
jgi:hypothetical protein